ncbi:hypothetical protein BJY01DRAFT_231300 [Aspergillus pseudoustus]|uniref:Uncharacterized protein n=1 Tax=Aspergillus pseudoustus TaxID=1810923 RepID=A0ABR4KVU8_9EURO
MAPVPRRPPPTPLIPRPTLIVPSTPVPVTSFIPRKLFLQLLAGTVCIFILTVLFWKFPGIVRFFTKNKVLREGNATTTRYVKTWYGWVTSQRHESNKRVLRKLLAKLNNLASWRSSKVDFQWVWWDHGEQNPSTSQDRGKERLPKWMRGNGFVTADAIWNSGSVPRHTPGSNSRVELPSFPSAAGALLPPNAPEPIVLCKKRAIQTNVSLHEAFGNIVPARYPLGRRLRHTDFAYDFGSNTGSLVVPHINKRLKLLWQLPHDRGPSRIPIIAPALNNPSFPQSFSTPCLSQPRRSPPTRGIKPHAVSRSESAEVSNIPSGSLPNLQRSRKYQIWSARMGLLTLKCIGLSTHTLPRGPPGTPQSSLFGSLSFGNSADYQINEYYGRANNPSSSDISDLSLGSSEHQYSVSRLTSVKGHETETDIPDGQSVSSSSVPLSLPLHRLPPPHDKGLQNDETTLIGKAHSQKRSGPERKADYIVQANGWSHWEVRLLDNLHRRLEWLSDQLNPGRRTFHFALLANHWLNTETWIVYDPISRVSIDARRRLGDPRFNIPYPNPQWGPHPKYPKTHHCLAHTPKINAWRAAMNQSRRAAGLRKFIKRIELYDSSAEDPPDGKVDPASWIIRKPPQGVSLTSRQMETYYEGGAGWQEKLSDWQKIRRGYRIQKAIHEGRVNRTRAKEIAYGIGRCYQRAAARLFRPETDGEMRLMNPRILRSALF